MTRQEMVGVVDEHYPKIGEELRVWPGIAREPDAFNLAQGDHASYSPVIRAIAINWDRMRSPVDVVFNLAHEMRHAWQDERGLLLPSSAFNNFYEYKFSHTEQDANAYALKYLESQGYRIPAVEDFPEEDLWDYRNLTLYGWSPGKLEDALAKLSDVEIVLGSYLAFGREPQPILDRHQYPWEMPA